MLDVDGDVKDLFSSALEKKVSQASLQLVVCRLSLPLRRSIWKPRNLMIFYTRWSLAFDYLQNSTFLFFFIFIFIFKLSYIYSKGNFVTSKLSTHAVWASSRFLMAGFLRLVPSIVEIIYDRTSKLYICHFVKTKVIYGFTQSLQPNTTSKL